MLREVCVSPENCIDRGFALRLACKTAYRFYLPVLFQRNSVEFDPGKDTFQFRLSAHLSDAHSRSGKLRAKVTM